MELWLCGRFGAEGRWEFNGVFSSHEKAVAACTHEHDFVAPVMLDERAPEPTLYFDPIEYPLLTKEE